jgi:hypothetical protein
VIVEAVVDALAAAGVQPQLLNRKSAGQKPHEMRDTLAA